MHIHEHKLYIERYYLKVLTLNECTHNVEGAMPIVQIMVNAPLRTQRRRRAVQGIELRLSPLPP